MNDKSCLSLEEKLCIVCGKPIETGNLLLDMRREANLDCYMLSGSSLCSEHEKLRQEGYVAVVECDPEKSAMLERGGMVHPSEIHRTGEVAYLKRGTFEELFGLPITALGLVASAVFVEPQVMSQLKALLPEVRQ